VFLESDEWIPVGKEGTTYYLDAGSPDEDEDVVTLVSFSPIVDTSRPFHLKGTLYPGITCKAMDGAPHGA